MDSPRHTSQTGLALTVVILIMAALMGLAAALTSTISMDTGLRGSFDRATLGFYAAESGLNRGMGDYRNIFLAFNLPQTSDLAVKSIAVGNRTVIYQISDVTAYEAGGNPPSITIPPGQLFGGLNSIEYNYLNRSSASRNGDTESQVNAEFTVGYIPLFQFVAFYKRDPEIAPGPDMTLNGRIHTNSDLHLNAGATLHISDNPPAITMVQVSASGSITRGLKWGNICDTQGTVTVDMLQDIVAPVGRLDPQDLNCNGAVTRDVPSTELATWKGSMVNQIQSISVPEPDITASGGTYWTKADLRIILKLTGAPPYTMEVQNADGTRDDTLTNRLGSFIADTPWNVTSGNSSLPGTRPIFYTDVPFASCCPHGNPTGCHNADATCYNPVFTSNDRVYTTSGAAMTDDTDYRRGGFYNWRDHKWIYLLNVNIHDLLAWNLSHSSTALFKLKFPPLFR